MTFLKEREADLSREMIERTVQPRPSSEDQREAVDAAKLARLDHLSNFSKDLDELVAPYMNHHQKALTDQIRPWWRRLAG
jgi:hypothetical protein